MVGTRLTAAPSAYPIPQSVTPGHCQHSSRRECKQSTAVHSSCSWDLKARKKKSLDVSATPLGPRAATRTQRLDSGANILRTTWNFVIPFACRAPPVRLPAPCGIGSVQSPTTRLHSSHGPLNHLPYAAPLLAGTLRLPCGKFHRTSQTVNQRTVSPDINQRAI